MVRDNDRPANPEKTPAGARKFQNSPVGKADGKSQRGGDGWLEQDHRPGRGEELAFRDSHFRYAADAIFIHDEAGRIIDCNEEAESSLGYARDELQRLNISDLIATAAKKEAAPWGRLGPGQRLAIERTMARKDGSLFPVEAHIRRHDLSGRTLFVCTARDITKGKKAEEAARTLLETVQMEKNRLESLINSMADEVWFTDLDKKFTLANPSARREFGLGQAENVDLEKLVNSLIILREDGSSRPLEEAQPLRALAGEVVKNEMEILKDVATGEMRYRQVSSAPVRDGLGRILGAVSVVRDVTEQRRLENSLDRKRMEVKAMCDILPVGIAILNEKRSVLEINQSLERILGITREEIEQGKHGKRKYLKSDGAPMPLEEMPSSIALREQRAVENIEIGVVKEDGEIVWTSVSAAPLFGFGVVVVTTDITERKLAGEALSRHIKEVEDGNAALRVLLKQRERDKQEFEEAVAINIDLLVMPHLEYLKTCAKRSEEVGHLRAIETALGGVTSTFSIAMSRKIGNLSPKEIQIANLVKEGKQDKYIAELLNVSMPTVRAHRRNIRKKLELTGKKANLQSFLAAQGNNEPA